MLADIKLPATIAETCHKIDPHADTVIILKNPLVDFAVWGNTEAKKPDPSKLFATFKLPALANDPAAEKNVVGQNAPEIEYRVSSSHLRLASPHFERMLSGGKWKEGINDKDGRHYITVEEWDKDALLILLNIFHHRGRKVPRTVSLDMLAKIAILVDYYDCLEALELWTQTWVQNLKNTAPLPSELCRDLILWMHIAWVLKLPQEFTHTTAIAIKMSKQGELPTLGLPITAFVGRIDVARNRAINTIVSQLQGLIEEYRSPNYRCEVNAGQSFLCGSVQLGALAKQLDSLGLFAPYPTVPFRGMSFWEIYSKVLEIKSSGWSHPQSFYGGGPTPCDLKKKTEELAKKASNGMQGLDLRYIILP